MLALAREPLSGVLFFRTPYPTSISSFRPSLHSLLQVRRDGDHNVRDGLRTRASAALAGPSEQDHVEVLHVQRRCRVRLRRQRAPALAVHLGEIHRHSGQNPARDQRSALLHVGILFMRIRFNPVQVILCTRLITCT